MNVKDLTKEELLKKLHFYMAEGIPSNELDDELLRRLNHKADPTEAQLVDHLNACGYPKGKVGELLAEIQSRLWQSCEPALVQEVVDELRMEVMSRPDLTSDIAELLERANGDASILIDDLIDDLAFDLHPIGKPKTKNQKGFHRGANVCIKAINEIQPQLRAAIATLQAENAEAKGLLEKLTEFVYDHTDTFNRKSPECCHCQEKIEIHERCTNPNCPVVKARAWLIEADNEK